MKPLVYIDPKAAPIWTVTDGVIINNEIKFRWMDRIRLLFGCKLIQHFHVATENVVGRTLNMKSNSYVEPFWTYDTGRLGSGTTNPGADTGDDEVVRGDSSSP